MNLLKFNDLPDILDVRTVSKYVGVSYNRALQFIKYELKYIKIGNRYKVTKKELQNYLER